MSVMSVRWPFVGRSEELELIEEAMAGGNAPGFVLAGAAGVGKTRLLREVVRTADTARYLARSIVATPATSGIPFGALAPLLPARLPSASSPGNLLRFAADALTDPAGSRRLVLGVDDAHVLDETSAGLLHQLALSGRAFVLASVRSGEPAPGPITSLWKDEVVERIDVQALSRAEMERVLVEVLEGQIETETAGRLWRTTGGNMLFLRELVGAGLDTGALARVEGVWRWLGDWVVAPRLAELLTHRIGRLEPEEHQALELVAYGAPVDADALGRLVDPDVLAAVEDKDLLHVERAGEREEVYLAHPLYGEVLRAECPPLRARRIKRRLADAVEAAGARGKDDWLRIATWRLDAAAPVRPEVLMSGVRQAWAMFDVALTERLAREAVRAGSGLAAVRVLWRALFLGGRGGEVEELLAPWLLAPSTPEEHRDLVVGRAYTLFWGLDRPAQAYAVLHEAREDATGPADRQTYAAVEALFRQHAGEATEALGLCEDLLDRATEPDAAEAGGPGLDGPEAGGPGLDGHAEAIARTAQAMALAYTGRLASTATLRDARKLVERWEGEVPFLGMMLDAASVQAQAYGGRLEAAKALADKAFEQADGSGPDFAAYIHRVGRAQVARLAGRPDTARRILREGLARYRDRAVGWYYVPAFLLGELAHAEALLGAGEAARAAMTELEAAPRSSVAMFDTWPDLARPWVAVALHDLPRAVELAREVAERFAAAGVGLEVAALHDLVRLGQPARAVDRLTELATGMRGRLPALAATHARAVVDRDGETLDEVAAGFEALGAELHAAEAYAMASAAHHDAGRQASGRAAATRSALLLDRCEGARTPALEAIQAPDLTPRERDIARLAASGLSNREIADRLVLSKRTVDNHLYQAYAKLGISGRAGLAGLFGSGSE